MKKYCVYREDDVDEFMGWFHTKKEAQEQIKESKRFDKEYGNPFEEKYYIKVIEIKEGKNEDI